MNRNEPADEEMGIMRTVRWGLVTAVVATGLAAICWCVRAMWFVE